MAYYVSYAIMDNSGAQVGHGGAIEEHFVLPRSVADIKRLGDNMTDHQRSLRAIEPGYWLSITSWSEMGY